MQVSCGLESCVSETRLVLAMTYRARSVLNRADCARYLDTEEVLKAKVQVLANLIRSSETHLFILPQGKTQHLSAKMMEHELEGLGKHRTNSPTLCSFTKVRARTVWHTLVQVRHASRYVLYYTILYYTIIYLS